MRYHWLEDRIQQKQFKIIWRKGIENLADYFTKHHTGTHHNQVRPIYLYEQDSTPRTLQGCIKLLAKNKAHGERSQMSQIISPGVASTTSKSTCKIQYTNLLHRCSSSLNKWAQLLP